jgi:signal transduction histidine kinase
VTTPFWIILALIALAIGWIVGRRQTSRPQAVDAGQGGTNPLARSLERVTGAVEQGRVPDENGPEEIVRLQSALVRAWAPRNAEREDALRQALGRIAAFLEESVEGPLKKVLDGDQALLREGVDRALGGLKDLEFYLREPLTPDETHNLVPLVQQVVRDFIADWEVAVRFAAPAVAVRAHIHRDTFLDALYLLLHNAGHFSDWKTVEVKIDEDEGRARVSIRDHGPGFSDEALERARDLFYTTKPAGLGLGIPFARKVIEGFGGQLELHNAPTGGAEVVLSLPGA